MPLKLCPKKKKIKNKSQFMVIFLRFLVILIFSDQNQIQMAC